MVAAAALFIASSAPTAVRLIGVWSVTALFYGVGLVLHAKIIRLRPAAVAFAGTALALVPFAGLATYNLGFPDAPVVWLITSVVGAVAYVVTAIRLSSRLIVYLSMGFFLSTAWSSVAVFGAALAWYFTILIVFSAVLVLIGNLLGKQGVGPQGRANLYARPLAALGPWFAPLGLIASLVFSLALNAADHTLVLGAGVFYYAVMAIFDSASMRRWNYVGLRLSLTLAAPFAGWLVGESWASSAGTMTVVLAVQLVLVAHNRRSLGTWLRTLTGPDLDVQFGVPLTALLALVWSVGLSVSRHDAGAWVWSPALPFVVALLTAVAVVPALSPRGEWLPLPSLGGMLMAFSLLKASDWTIFLAVAAACSLLRFVTARAAEVRQVMLMATRLLATALVASAMVAYVPSQPSKTAVIVAVLAVIAAGQLFADTMMGRYGVPSRVTALSGAAWAVIGAVLVVALAVLHTNAQLMATGGLVERVQGPFVLAAVAMTVSVCLHSWLNLPKTGQYVPAEIMAPAYLVVAGFSAGFVFAASGAVVAWGTVVVFLVGMALWVPAQAASGHRWLYWRSARAASLLLVIGLFQLWQEHVRVPTLWGSEVTLSMMLVVVLVAHILILAGALVRKRTQTSLGIDVLMTLVVAVLAAGTELLTGANETWTGGTVIAMLAVSTAVLGWCAARRSPAGDDMHSPLPTSNSGTHTEAWNAFWAQAVLAALVIPSIARDHGSTNSQVLLGLTSVATLLLAVRASQPYLRGAYFLLARIVVTILVAAMVMDFTRNRTTLTLTLSAVLLGQLLVQWLASTSAESRLVGEPRVLRASLWLLLAAQMIIPVAYVADAGGFDYGSAQRWVVVVEVAVLAVSSVVAQVVLKQRGASYLAIISVMGGAAIMAPVLWPGTIALAMAGLSVCAVLWRYVQTPRTADMRWYWLIATTAFLCTGALVDYAADPGILAIMWIVGGVALIVGAHVQNVPWLTLPGALMVVLAAALIRAQVFELTQLLGGAALAGFVVVLCTLYLVRLVLWGLADVASIQRWSLVGVAICGGFVFALMAMTERDVILLGALAFTITAVLAVFEAPRARRRIIGDVAILACALIWYWASSIYVDLGLFWLVQWLAAAFGALAVIRYAAKQPAVGRGLMMIAAGLATFGALLTFFSADVLEQLVSLLLFVALLLVGMIVDNRVFTIWGAAGVATAVLWYLRGFTYVLLAVLALALIGFALWRLNRKKPPTQAPGLPHGGSPHTGAPNAMGPPAPPQ
ncbi:hypothetical protein GCM10025779_13530 [Arthrobacter cryoconiti]